MKAKIRKTGEIVDIIRYGNDGSYTVFRDSKGEIKNLPINFFSTFEEIVEVDGSIDWEQRIYEIARDFLPSAAVSVNQNTQDWMDGMTYQKASALVAVRYAEALVEELKKGAKKWK